MISHAESLYSFVSKAKPFRERLIIPAVEEPNPEVSKMMMDVTLPVAELPQSPVPVLVPEKPIEPANVKKKTSTSSRKTSAKPSKVPKIKSQSFPKFKKFPLRDLPYNSKRQTKVSGYFQSLSWRLVANSKYLPDIPPTAPAKEIATGSNVHEESFWNDVGPLLSSSPLPDRASEHSIICLSSNDNVICISDSSDC